VKTRVSRDSRAIAYKLAATRLTSRTALNRHTSRVAETDA
jgi:hypothetical protein